MRKRAAVASVLVVVAAIAIACVPARGPLVPCAWQTLDPRVAPEVERAANDAGFTLVRCVGAEYGLALPGARASSPDELLAWKRRVGRALLAIDGVEMVGVGACCDGGDGKPFDPRGCVRVTVDQRSPAATRLAETVRKLHDGDGDGDGDVRVSVAQTYARAPRCAPRDPGCGPLPYEGGGCLDADATRDWTRHVVDARAAGAETLAPPCANDGECVSCNTVCTDYTHRPTACTSELSNTLREAYCGCVDGACRWFEIER